MNVVSDKAFEAVLKESLLTREQFRILKGYDKKQMERHIASVYRSGFEDGYEAAENRPSDQMNVEWPDILQRIAEVKGVGEKLLSAIDQHVREVFEDEID